MEERGERCSLLGEEDLPLNMGPLKSLICTLFDLGSTTAWSGGSTTHGDCCPLDSERKSLGPVLPVSPALVLIILLKEKVIIGTTGPRPA
jgi:hypothetical protein